MSSVRYRVQRKMEDMQIVCLCVCVRTCVFGCGGDEIENHCDASSITTVLKRPSADSSGKRLTLCWCHFAPPHRRRMRERGRCPREQLCGDSAVCCYLEWNHKELTNQKSPFSQLASHYSLVEEAGLGITGQVRDQNQVRRAPQDKAP